MKFKPTCEWKDEPSRQVLLTKIEIRVEVILEGSNELYHCGISELEGRCDFNADLF